MKNWKATLGGNEFKVMRLQDAPPVPATDTPEKIEAYLRPRLAESLRYNPDVENFGIVLLNTRKSPIGFEVVSNGTLDTILIHPREVFKAAILFNAAALILVHNHPSGNPSPSEADIKVTRDLIRAGQLMKIEVLDHIILGAKTESDKGYTSLRELGYFYS